MGRSLKVTIGQHSDKGRKALNQDFYGASVPREPLLSTKGIALAVADGIGSSRVSQVASEFAVMGLMEDYYCTSEAWSVKKSVERVLTATNAWLHSRTRESEFRFDADRGYVCTFSGMVLKSTTAHLFHIGDTRIYRAHGGSLEQLTEDHRVRVSGEKSYLSRAVGFNSQLEIDYVPVQLQPGDRFLLATDGVYEHVDPAFLAEALHSADLDAAARAIVDEALKRGSDDNLTVQLVRVDELPLHAANELQRRATALALPPLLEPRQSFDGYRIVRELKGSSRSHIYLATEETTEAVVVLKTPSIDLQGDPAYLERFLMEEWVARRIDSPHVIKPCAPTRERKYLYVATEFVDGQTLAQWMIDQPRPGLETVRGIVEQVAKGLQAFHRMEMLHQDLRPDNVMIDRTNTVKIIDFGATRVAGIAESDPDNGPEILGTAQYTAPEYFIGQPASDRSDQFSLAVIAYQMLTGRLPYGLDVPKTRTLADQRKLRYRTAMDDDRALPLWVDGALRKALHPDPMRRYETISEFTQDLRHPNAEFTGRTAPPLVERHPVMFWKAVAALLGAALVASLFLHFGVK